MKKRILSVLIMTLTFLLVFAACSGDKATDGNVKESDGDVVTGVSEEISTELNVKTSDTFGTFETVDINGNKVDQTVFQGKKVTMVNVWATFCTPCIGEMPDLEKISKDYADKDFQIVGIVLDVAQNSDGSYDEGLMKEAEAVISQTGVTYLNLLPSDSLLENELGSIFSVPTTYFLDAQGNLLGESYIGSRSYDDWCQLIDANLAR